MTTQDWLDLIWQEGRFYLAATLIIILAFHALRDGRK